MSATQWPRVGRLLTFTKVKDAEPDRAVSEPRHANEHARETSAAADRPPATPSRPTSNTRLGDAQGVGLTHV